MLVYQRLLPLKLGPHCGAWDYTRWSPPAHQVFPRLDGCSLRTRPLISRRPETWCLCVKKTCWWMNYKGCTWLYHVILSMLIRDYHNPWLGIPINQPAQKDDVAGFEACWEVKSEVRTYCNGKSHTFQTWDQVLKPHILLRNCHPICQQLRKTARGSWTPVASVPKINGLIAENFYCIRNPVYLYVLWIFYIPFFKHQVSGSTWKCLLNQFLRQTKSWRVQPPLRYAVGLDAVNGLRRPLACKFRWRNWFQLVRH